MEKTGVLFVNLGTPDSPSDADVHRYLIEFLTDGRVIDIPWLSRQLLVRGAIVPQRYKLSAASYRKIWTEEGSPLMIYGRRVQQALNERLGNAFHVELAMRYQSPSIASVLDTLLKQDLSRLIVLPLFPQYASATTGSVLECVMGHLSKLQVIPPTTFLGHFYDNPGYIGALCAIARENGYSDYDHILFSYHGLPERQLIKADGCGHCLKKVDCCASIGPQNRRCYAAQCHATTAAIVRELGIDEGSYSIAFQSRLGKEPWVRPFTNETIVALAKAGKKRLLVFSPSFVCDCLETLYEIGIEYGPEFTHAGGEKLDLMRGLNDHPLWIDTLVGMIQSAAPMQEISMREPSGSCAT